MMKYSIRGVCLIAAMLVTGCGGPASQTEEDQSVSKESFFVETATVADLQASSSLTKNGILLGADTVTVTAQIGGRVSSIGSDIGETVSQGSRVITMSDSAGSVSFGVERAQAALEQARISYDQTLLSIDQQIQETQRTIAQSQNQLKSSQNQARAAQIQANNAQLEGSSAAQLQLDQLQQSLRTARLDLETKVLADEQQLDNFVATARNIRRDASLLYNEILDETDKILGVSDINERENDRYERYLAVRNTALKFRAETQLRQLLSQENVLEDLRIDQSTLSQDLAFIQEQLDQLLPFLQLMEEVLLFTSTGNAFSQQELNGLNQQIDGLQSAVQGQVSGITQQINGIESFLRTYEAQQQSIRENIEGLEIQIEGTRENLETAQDNVNVTVDSAGLGVESAILGVESAQARLQDLQDNRVVTERSLANAIRQAEIALREIQTNAGKFTIESPIQGSISEIVVSRGQEVNPGTPLFTITSTQDLEIEIGLTSNEIDLVGEGQRVTITDGDNTFGGVIDSITRTANQSLSFKAIIIPDQSPRNLGGVVRVEIPLESNQLLLPLRNVQIVTTDTGRITTLQNDTIETLTVSLGPIQGSNIVIQEPLDNQLQIITSSVRTFDPEKFVVEVKK